MIDYKYICIFTEIKIVKYNKIRNRPPILTCTMRVLSVSIDVELIIEINTDYCK
jgi:hypothetical protein